MCLCLSMSMLLSLLHEPQLLRGDMFNNVEEN